jgi:DNA repair protein RadC
MPLFDRPRERLVRAGPHALTDADLLAVVLGFGTRGADAVCVARSILSRYPELVRLASVGPEELAALPGVGMVQACRVTAALALAGRLGAQPFERGDPVLTLKDVWERCGRRLAHLDHEVLVALALDARNRVITELTVAQGGVCSVECQPGDLFRLVLRTGAAGVLLVHNHPSGDATPSEADEQCTERLRRAGQLLGITLVDHVVVSRGGFASCLRRARPGAGS